MVPSQPQHPTESMTTNPTSSAPPPAPPPSPASDTRVADRVYGAVAGAAILLALFFFVFGGTDSGREPVVAPAAVPQLTLLSPVNGAELDQPLLVEFDAGTVLARRAGGWAAGDLHLHLYAGSTEVMPGPGDLQPVSGTRYVWRVPRLPPGERTLRIGWSGLDHRSMDEGASGTVTVRLR
jgi:hypothetical protein